MLEGATWPIAAGGGSFKIMSGIENGCHAYVSAIASYTGDDFVNEGNDCGQTCTAGQGDMFEMTCATRSID